MSYKTILVHFNDERRLVNLLNPALDLARRFEAHLIGLAVLPPPIVEPSFTPGGAGPTIIESHRKAFAQEAARMKTAFETASRDAGLITEWVSEDAKPWPVWRKVVEYARAADLIVSAQPDPDWPLSLMMEAPDQLVLQTGRPVLLIPNRGSHVGAGRRVLIAWNGRREAARAAFDALPLLKKAAEVKVLWVNPQDEEDEAKDLPAADLCTGLARHKVTCEATEVIQPKTGVGETLMARVHESGADLLVMGCYGHSRFTELILGGVSRYVLQNMTVPVLMAP